MRILVLIMILVSCGQDELLEPLHVAPEAVDTLLAIQEEAAERELVLDLSMISIKMEDELHADTVVGVCKSDLYHVHKTIGRIMHLETKSKLVKTIVLKRESWEKASSKRKYNTLIHEIGHCHYNMEHRDDDTDFMFPYLRSNYTLELYWDTLNDKFFSEVQDVLANR